MAAAHVRLYVDHPLGAGQSVPLDRDQAHYLFGVMRRDVGDPVFLFNGQDGEWEATVSEAGKRGGMLTCAKMTRPVQHPPDLWLIFAPIKKARTDFIVEKATELGTARILPVQTDYTNSERIRRDRLQSHAIEAAEQCGGTFVPEVADMEKLPVLLEKLPDDRQLMFCDETRAGEPPTDLSLANPGPWAILIGPEGGFSRAERDRLSQRHGTHCVSLGPRILRADTATVAALTLWQSTLGDWR